MFKHLLVPTDGSKLSDDTVDKAVSFAKDANAKITFVHVEQPVPTVMYTEGTPTNAPESYASATDSEAMQILNRCGALAEEAGVAFAIRIAVNHAPNEAIIAAAEAAACDLIFMASHGRRGLKGLVLGSETHKVLTHTKIPVLVYR